LLSLQREAGGIRTNLHHPLALQPPLLVRQLLGRQGQRPVERLQGRLAPSVDDVLTLAKPVLQHRMALTFSARADGQSVHDIIDKLCAYANDV